MEGPAPADDSAWAGSASEIGKRFAFPGDCTVLPMTLRAIFMDIGDQLGKQEVDGLRAERNGFCAEVIALQRRIASLTAERDAESCKHTQA